MGEKNEKIYIGHEVIKSSDFDGYSYNFGELNGCICDHTYYISKCFTLLIKVGKYKYANYFDESIIYELIDPNELVGSQDVFGCDGCENFKFRGMLNCGNHPDEKSSSIGVLDVQPISVIDNDIDVAKFIIDEYNMDHGNLFLQIRDVTHKSIIQSIDNYCYSFAKNSRKPEGPKKVRKYTGK